MISRNSRHEISQQYSTSKKIGVDVFVILFVFAIIYSTVLFTKQIDANFNPSFEIDLSLYSLPLYALFSAIRGLIAYVFSFVFTIVVGYSAAKSKTAEKFLIPLLDIFQSIPVLGFLPGLVLGLIALFPKSNFGLELAAILMIFTGQVWNMTFSFYTSLKSIPTELNEASAIMNLNPLKKLLTLELPFAAVNLVWNSIMSMAGGWFFLTVCEAFTLGDQQYRLPGIGAYMAEAIEKNNTQAIIGAVIAMAAIVIILDLLIWRPALALVHQYRLENNLNTQGGSQPEEQIISFVFKHSFILKILRKVNILKKRKHLFKSVSSSKRKISFNLPQLNINKILSFLRWPLLILFCVGLLLSAVKLFHLLSQVNLSQWLEIVKGTVFTFLRVLFAVALATVWTLPAGIWISRSAVRMKILQPITQLLASFPAPMLYPLILGLTFKIGLSFEISSMLLIFVGVQWYVLFNTLAGGLRISQEIENSLKLMNVSSLNVWRFLYVPSVFPALITGWITAAGGAWNASIVAEYLSYKGETIHTLGLGSLISESAVKADFSMLAACLFVMVITVIILNRIIWNPLYRVSQTRFRLDM